MVLKHLYIVLALKKVMLGDAYNLTKTFIYPDHEIQDYGPITEENHDRDTSMKLARIQQGIDKGLA